MTSPFRLEVGEPGLAAGVEGAPAMLAAPLTDTVVDAGVVGPLTIRAASVRGAGHRYDGTPRQDDVALGLAGPGSDWLVVAVADGVSAGAKSHVAARVAVRSGVQLVAAALETGDPATMDWDLLIGTLAGHVLLQARREVGDESLEAREAARHMATTVAFAVIPVEADADGCRTCTVVPIGDTSVWVLRSTGSWEPITAVKNDGEAVAGSATFALPLLPSAPVAPLAATLGPGDALFALTDGVGDPLGDGSGEVGRALASWWALPPNRHEFAAQVDFGRRSHTDDRTAVGVWTVPPVDAEPIAGATDASPVPPPPDAPPSPDAPPPPDPPPPPDATVPGLVPPPPDPGLFEGPWGPAGGTSG